MSSQRGAPFPESGDASPPSRRLKPDSLEPNSQEAGRLHASSPEIALHVNDRLVTAPDEGASLLWLLREFLGIRSVKDGCSPQGQCGACTVLVDGMPRVSCVTPARRVAGRRVTTLEGLGGAAAEWAEAFCSTGASQCGFCTPGIILRFEGLRRKSSSEGDPRRALAAHLCRCTGWQTILEAWEEVTEADDELPPPAICSDDSSLPPLGEDSNSAAKPTVPAAGDPEDDSPPAADRRRDLRAAAARAQLEGGCPQSVGASVALGEGGFADDAAPFGALVAVPVPDGGWALGESIPEARAAAGQPAGRRSTLLPSSPLEVPPGDWASTLRTSWVEPAYLELDASWCSPGGEPANPLGNGGAFGGKRSSEVRSAARRLADETGRAVRVLYSREDAARLGPKRPPLAAGANPDGRGVLRAVRTRGLPEVAAAAAPDLKVEEYEVPGPPTTMHARVAVVAEVTALLAGAKGRLEPVRLPDGGEAMAWLRPGSEEVIEVEVCCGLPLDEVTLRSYCIGAAHMAYGLVTSEAVAVTDEGAVADLTVRSFGVVPAVSSPKVEVRIVPSTEAPVNGSDAVFAAVAAATWLSRGCPPAWPTDRFRDRRPSTRPTT